MSQKIREGNDIDITWSLYDADENPYIVAGRDVSIELNVGTKRVKISEFNLSGNQVHFVYRGKDQKHLGSYALKYIENAGENDMITFDTKDAFTLVAHSWQAVDTGETPETIQIEVVTIGSVLLEKMGPRGYSAYEIAVQNGFVGTEEEWLESLKGEDGKDGEDGSDADVTAQNIANALGYTPADANDVPTAEQKAAWDAKYNKPQTGIPSTDLSSGVQTSLGKADSAVQPAALQAITDLIPSQASSENKLADKEFVNSSIATATATFRGTYNLVSDLSLTVSATQEQIAAAIATKLAALSIIADNEDYVFVQIPTADATPTEISRVDRYKYNGTVWAYEWSLNNSSFTAAQWAAINSNITAAAVTKLSNLPDKPVDTASQTLSAAEQLQARTNIGATAPEVFWATYGTTTLAEITAAYNAGKICKVNRNNSTYELTVIGSTYAMFNSVNGNYVYKLTCDTEGWSALNYSNELVSNKVSSWSSSPNDNHFPTEKLVYDSLYKRGVISQTQTWTGGYPAGYDYTMSDLVWGDIPKSNIDLYEAAGATFNDTTGYFELNGLTDISYEEMMNVYLASHHGTGTFSFDNFKCAYNGILNARTILPVRIYAETRYVFATQAFNSDGAETESIQFISIYRDVTLYLRDANNCFRYNRKLKRVIGPIGLYDAVMGFATGCSSLEDITLKLKASVVFQDSPRLSIASILYMINNEAATSAITITLHATSYARAIADTDVQTALQNHPLVTLASA